MDQAEKRRCARCAAVLSQSNPDELCRPCRSKISQAQTLENSLDPDSGPHHHCRGLRVAQEFAAPWKKTTTDDAPTGIGPIIARYRKNRGLSQMTLAKLLGVDQSYVSLLERGSRAGRDMQFRQQVAACLGIPPHLLGLAPEHYAGADIGSVIELVPSIIDLATMVREAGRSDEAAKRLHFMLIRLEAFAAAGIDNPTLREVIARTRSALGVVLGDILYDDQLVTSSTYLQAAWDLVKDSDDAQLKTEILRRLGNELRKRKHYAAASTSLEAANSTASDKSAVAVARARLYAAMGDIPRFREAIKDAHAALDRGILRSTFNETVIDEVELRGLIDLDRRPEVISLLDREPQPPATLEVTAQWRTLAAITRGQGLLYIGAVDRAIESLRTGMAQARQYRLPRQLQRAMSLVKTASCADRLRNELTTAYDFLLQMQQDVEQWLRLSTALNRNTVLADAS